ncbi:mitochondrial adenylate/guanylate cyclase domain-containing protein [Andalucia godoyi]|uniref:Mitochondrial adenylate/guanylate cyclase domain-containing protein n=1 Tax=Andalucia godoyi TaxID=505711 RepID=A0A8K0AK03_ANDGO|nr:mitochondrial adenylate/guanylate cyclase domain-containing protein [Andalucia godoyi]|eukprot:ANDGO_08596.mRNA.1 mitochondrial adenylate/guanylate cyclase domain-containing protein
MSRASNSPSPSAFSPIPSGRGPSVARTSSAMSAASMSPSSVSSKEVSASSAVFDKYGLVGSQLRKRFQIDDEVGNTRVPLKRILGLFFDSLSLLFVGEDRDGYDEDHTSRSSFQALIDSVLKTLWHDVSEKVEKWIDAKDPEIDNVKSSMSFAYAQLQEKHRLVRREIEDQKQTALMQRIRIEAFGSMLDELRSSILKEAIFWKEQAFRMSNQRSMLLDPQIIHFFQGRLLLLDEIASAAYQKVAAAAENRKKEEKFQNLYFQLYHGQEGLEMHDIPPSLDGISVMLHEMKLRRETEAEVSRLDSMASVGLQTEPMFTYASDDSFTDVSDVDDDAFLKVAPASTRSRNSSLFEPFADLQLVPSLEVPELSSGRKSSSRSHRRTGSGWSEIVDFEDEKQKNRKRTNRVRHVAVQSNKLQGMLSIDVGTSYGRGDAVAQTSPRILRDLLKSMNEASDAFGKRETELKEEENRKNLLKKALDEQQEIARAVADSQSKMFEHQSLLDKEEELIKVKMENELLLEEQKLFTEKIRAEEDGKWRPQLEFMQKQLEKATAEINKLKATSLLPMDLVNTIQENSSSLENQLQRVEQQFTMRERELERVARQLKTEKDSAIAALEAELVDARRRVEVAKSNMDPLSTDYAVLEDQMTSLAMRLKLYKEEKKDLEKEPVRYPSGSNVAIVFTDVENSTPLWEKHTKAMYQSLKIHNRLLRDVLKRHGGYEVKSEGDGFMLAFHTSLEACLFCIEFQLELLNANWPEEILKSEYANTVRGKMSGKVLFRGLRVRSGFHVGEPIVAADLSSGRIDYFGVFVNTAARISGCAHGGQIVCSHEAWLQVSGHRKSNEFVGRDLKVHKLKGSELSYRIFQISPISVANRKFPPLKTVSSNSMSQQEMLNKYQQLSQNISGMKLHIHSVGTVLDGVSRIGKKHPLVRKAITIEDKMNALSKRLQLIREEKSVYLSDTASTPPNGPGVALVFTDVESSTSMWEKYTTAMYASLKIHNKLMRDLIQKHNGYEVKTEGDGAMLAFWSALDALKYLLDFQQQLLEQEWPEEILGSQYARVETNESGSVIWRGLRVRSGIHCAEHIMELDPTTGRGDYHGRSVNRSARVAGAGCGGQIVVSQAAYDAVISKKDDLDFVVEDLGTHTFKGLDSPEHVYQILPAALRDRSFKGLKPQAPSTIASEQVLLSKYANLSIELDEVKKTMGVSKRTLSYAQSPTAPTNLRFREVSERNLFSSDEFASDPDTNAYNSATEEEDYVEFTEEESIVDVSETGSLSDDPSLDTDGLTEEEMLVMKLNAATSPLTSVRRISVEKGTSTHDGGAAPLSFRTPREPASEPAPESAKTLRPNKIDPLADLPVDETPASPAEVSLASAQLAAASKRQLTNAPRGRNAERSKEEKDASSDEETAESKKVSYSLLRAAKEDVARENREHSLVEQLTTLATWVRRIVHAYELALAALYASSSGGAGLGDRRQSQVSTQMVVEQFLKNIRQGSIEGNTNLTFPVTLTSENSFLSGGTNPNSWLQVLDPNFRAEIARCKNVLKPLLTRIFSMPGIRGSDGNLLSKGKGKSGMDPDFDKDADDLMPGFRPNSAMGIMNHHHHPSKNYKTDLPFDTDPIKSIPEADEQNPPLGPVKGSVPLHSDAKNDNTNRTASPNARSLNDIPGFDGHRVLSPSPWYGQVPESESQSQKRPQFYVREDSFLQIRENIQEELGVFERTRRFLEDQATSDKQFVRFTKPALPDPLEQKSKIAEKLNEALALARAHEKRMDNSSPPPRTLDVKMRDLEKEMRDANWKSPQSGLPKLHELMNRAPTPPGFLAHAASAGDIPAAIRPSSSAAVSRFRSPSATGTPGSSKKK